MAGKKTFEAASSAGFDWMDSVTGAEFSTYPEKPTFPPVTDRQKQDWFGPIDLKKINRELAKQQGNKKLTVGDLINEQMEENLKTVNIPQLVSLGLHKTGNAQFHKNAATQFIALWQAWEEAGLLDRIKSYDGTYDPRYVRGYEKQQILSNHAFGTAFDINAKFNGLDQEPAKYGTEGCVYELVPLAYEFGFYWGGYFDRKDGMHFEVAEIVDLSSVKAAVTTGTVEVDAATVEVTGTTSTNLQIEGIKSVATAIETEINSSTLSLNAKLTELKSAIAALEMQITGATSTVATNPANVPINTTSPTGKTSGNKPAKPVNTPTGGPQLSESLTKEGWELYRVLPDTEVQRWDGLPRTLHKSWRQPQFNETPQVVPLTTEKGLEQETGFTKELNASWEKLFKQLNSKSQDESLNKKRFEFVTANNTAWFNIDPKKRKSGWYHGIESLAMGSAPGLWDNVLACGDAGGDWLEVLTLRPEASTEGISREATPWFVHRFTLVGHRPKEKNRPFWADTKHGECYAALVTIKPVYIRKDWVEKVKLPVKL